MGIEDVQGFEIMNLYLTRPTLESARAVVDLHPELRDPGAIEALDGLIARTRALGHDKAASMQQSRDWLVTIQSGR